MRSGVRRFDPLLLEARPRGLLSNSTTRIGGRVNPALIEEAKRVSGTESDSELIELALANLAFEVDFPRAFAEAHDKFAAAGATVVGMSADDIDTLKRFSTEECRSKFAVGVATPDIIKAYDVALQRQGAPAGMANRVSYVIGQDGHVRFVYSNLDYRDHVARTLAAVQALKSAR